MSAYVVRRVLRGVAVLLLVTALTFLLFDVLPSGDPAQLRAGRGASPQAIASARHALGLDKPLYAQFLDYMEGVILHFNLGYSYYGGASVRSLIANRLPATLSLTIGAALLWLLVGVPAGIISAIKRGKALDRAAMGTALVLISTPAFWLGLLLLYLFASDVGTFPLLPGAHSYVGLTASPGKWLSSLVMPWIVLAASAAAICARRMRASLLEVMGQDYIRTARAKGLRERRVVWRHGVRAAIMPVIAALGIDAGALLGGAVLTETVFDIPGIGRLNYDAIIHSNFPVLQGTVLLAAIFMIVANVVLDISSAYLDPRVREL